MPPSRRRPSAALPPPASCRPSAAGILSPSRRRPPSVLPQAGPLPARRDASTGRRRPDGMQVRGAAGPTQGRDRAGHRRPEGRQGREGRRRLGRGRGWAPSAWGKAGDGGLRMLKGRRTGRTPAQISSVRSWAAVRSWAGSSAGLGRWGGTPACSQAVAESGLSRGWRWPNLTSGPASHGFPDQWGSPVSLYYYVCRL
jgi:hypothetical protein